MRQKQILLQIGVLLAISLIGIAPSWAVPFTTGGTPVIAIDGNGDKNVTVDILSLGGTSAYKYGYFLNGSSSFQLFQGGAAINTFKGGDVINFALYDGNRYYTLSGDQADNSYQVTMTFDPQVTIGAPQQPANWTAPYYYNVLMTWQLPKGVVVSDELTLDLTQRSNDGLAPYRVPEPTSIILLGAGLLILAMYRRKKLKLN